ncbi:MAG: hypothetical protein GXO27_00095 [Chlorobi bacterium]|nr:hypothetical protein [Chlorobiota bacterium]
MKLFEFFTPKLKELVEARSEGLPPYVRRTRLEAAEEMIRRGFPGPKDEAWRRSGIWHFKEKEFLSVPPPESLPPADFSGWNADIRIRMYNGLPVEFHGRITDERIHITSFRRAWDSGKRPPQWWRERRELVQNDWPEWAPLAEALSIDGLLISLKEGAHPLRVETLPDASEHTLAPGNMFIRLEPNTSLDLYLRYPRAKDALRLNLGGIKLEEGARLNLFIESRSGHGDMIFDYLTADLAAGARLHIWYLSRGEGYVRMVPRTFLRGEGAEARLRGLPLASRKGYMTHRIEVRHDAPETFSRQYFKGTASGDGRSLFHGRIRVNRGARNTQAYQQTDHILLSSKAKAHAQPFLEIYEDAVSCSHGATTGRLDSEALFYLRQRGLPLAEARRLMLESFAGEILETLADEGIRILWSEAVSRSLSEAVGEKEELFVN